MKKYIYFSLSLLFFISCSEKPKPKEATEKASVMLPSDQKYLGFWVGYFIADEHNEDETGYVPQNKINIAIKSIEGDSVTAQSIVAGNSRLLKGKIVRGAQRTSFEFNEPGDDRYDGKFTFDIVNDTLKGSWLAFNKTISVPKRVFTLTKKAFVYNAQLMLPENDYYDEYSVKSKKVTDTIDGKPETYSQEYYRAASESVYKINSSTHAFTEAELKNFKKLDLEILRNTIYARHGLTFKKKSYRQFFDDVDWYVPVSDNVDTALTALEKANVKLLAKFEKYAADNYDTFGR